MWIGYIATQNRICVMEADILKKMETVNEWIKTLILLSNILSKARIKIVSANYKRLSHLCELLVQAMSDKKQQKINIFCEPFSVECDMIIFPIDYFPFKSNINVVLLCRLFLYFALFCRLFIVNWSSTNLINLSLNHNIKT